MTPAGLYLHVPFCSGKCPYCDFYSLANPRLIPEWLQAVAREAALYARDFNNFDTLYIGGGTPSRLSRDDLSTLFDTLSVFEFFPDGEVTLEVNPEDVTREKMQALEAAGVNRLSMGIQSFDRAELTFLGRRHSVDQALAAIDTVRESGCRNLSLDLMYGLPGQTWEGWRSTIDKALEFQPEHLSCYQLTLEEGTGFHRRHEAGEFSLPDNDLSRLLFINTSRYLEDRGYVHYEISNFARGTGYRSKHNGKYWIHAPYLGLGPSSHSFQNGKRWWNVQSVRKYCEALKKGEFPVAGREELTREQIDLETIYLGLRTREGAPLDLLLKNPRNRNRIDRMLGDSLASVSGDRLVLTRKGMVVADRLTLTLSG